MDEFTSSLTRRLYLLTGDDFIWVPRVGGMKCEGRYPHFCVQWSRKYMDMLTDRYQCSLSLLQSAKVAIIHLVQTHLHRVAAAVVSVLAGQR